MIFLPSGSISIALTGYYMLIAKSSIFQLKMFLSKGSLNNNQMRQYMNNYLVSSSDYDEMDFQTNMVKSRVKEIEQRIQKQSSSVVEEESILQFDDVEDDDYQQPILAKQDQRDKIKEVQKMQIMKQSEVHMIKRNESHPKGFRYNDDEIDFTKIVESNQEKNQQYEPGGFVYKIDSQLPQLSSHQAPVDLSQKPIQNYDNNGAYKPQIPLEEEESKQKDSSDDVGEIDFNDGQSDEEKQQEPLIQIDNTTEVSKTDQKEVEEQVKEENPQQEQEQQQQTPQQPPPKKLPYPKPIAQLQIPDMRQFLTTPSPKGGMIQCTIKRDKSGMGRLYPKYYMHLTNGYQFLMVAKKRAINNTSNYIVSMNRKDPEKKNQDFLGKVRSNFLGTEFTLYDNGENPSKTKQIAKMRCELGVVLYESNLLGAKGPRRMKVLIPNVDPETNISPEYRPKNSKEGLLNDYKNGHIDNMIEYINRQPKWNDIVQAFVLNFYGRVDKPSVKNFQLIQQQAAEENIFLQFGRIGEDMFNLDFQWPISPLQAFQIAISSFDYKIACE